MTAPPRLEFALSNLGDNLPHPVTGAERTDAETHLRLVAQAVAAEAAGIEIFQLGEHHFNFYAISAPVVTLAAIAQHTTTLRLGTGVTLITTSDPVLVAEEANTLDVLSGGRAELAVGRGIHKPIFDAVGRSPGDANEIMQESLELLHRLLHEQDVTWKGDWRPPLEGVTIRPHPVRPVPLWSASTAAIELSGRLGLPAMWGSVLQPFDKLAGPAQAYRQAWADHGRAEQDLQFGISCHFHVARTSQQAREQFEPYWRHYMACGATLSSSNLKRVVQPMTRQEGSLFDTVPIVGSPEEVVDRIGRARDLLGLTRMGITIDMGGMGQDLVLETIALAGSDVIPHFQD
ncbi:MAG: hypothetical protein JWL64_2140 [Frankiales bacterium]|nr:hypothetical protein [Frankiales bacterium]